jgi:glycine/D-amino acid oxidase-like deaminating enzyme
MIADAPSPADLAAFRPEVCVIGGGPVGIVTALALARAGRRVLLLESGGRAPGAEAQALSVAESYSAATHHPPEITVARRLGGASNLWGGRCLPFDAIDYRARPWLGRGLGAWPIGAADLAPEAAAACEALAAGAAVFEAPLPGVAADDGFGFESLERWSNVPRIQLLHRAELEARPDLLVALGATATGFELADGRVAAVELYVEGRGPGRVAVPEVVLAAGGNESTRLLLAVQRRHPGLFGGPDGRLGRCYMGHVNGQIADIELAPGPLDAGLDFFQDGHGSYVRRRLVPSAATQERERLPNVAFWPVVPPIADPAHRSGPLSAVFLALSVAPLGRRLIAETIRLRHVGPPPWRRGAHLMNLVRDPGRTLGFAPWFLWKTKRAQPRLPGLFLRNPARRYGLEYHAEHLPHPESRLVLGSETDRVGLPRLRIDLHFSEADATAVVRAHDALDAWLGRNRLGRLRWRMPAGDRAAAVLAAARHGNHQIGTIPMGRDRRSAVVDRDCRSFDLPNLFVVSTAVLPSSGQANPTMTAVMLGLRLARRLAGAAPATRDEASESVE